MKNSFTKFTLAAAVVFACGVVSCSDDDPKGDNGEINDNPNVGETPVTAEQEKQFIEATATELKSILNPEDQQDFVQFCKDFSEEFDEFINGGNYDYPYDYAARGIRDLGNAVMKGNAFGISRAMQEISYSFDDIAGVYEPDFKYNEWVRTGDSKNVEYRFKVKGQNCSLTVAPANGTWTGSAQGYYEEDEYPYDEYPVLYKIAVPRNVKITLVQGSKTLANGTVNSDYNQKGMTASCDVNAQIANIALNTKADLTNDRCVANAAISVGGTQLIEAKGELKGHDMCNFERIMQILEAHDSGDNETDDEAWINNSNNIHSLFESGVANTNILRRIFVTGSCDNMARLAFVFSNWSDVEENKAQAQAQLKFINDHIKAQFFLGASDDASGDIIWQLKRDVYNWGYGSSYEYWTAEPVMKFNSDGTTYRFEAYFNEEDFAGTIEVFQGIVDLYEGFFGF